MAAQSEFITAINQLAAERGLDVNEILDAIKQAIRTGYKKDYPDDEGFNLKVEIDPDAGNISVLADKKVVAEVTDSTTQISLADAKKIESKLREGDHVEIDITPQGDFGRVAAQTARQVIMQTLRETEKEAVLRQFKDKLGQVESAVVQRVDHEGSVIVEINRATAIMPSDQRITGEFYRSGSRIKVLLQKFRVDPKGKTLLVSRAAPEFLSALFALEVPEITSGTVEVMGIAREPGSRSKMAVKSNSAGVDAIGSCVGQRGVRINAVTNELRFNDHEEKIDIINYSDDVEEYISNAIKPANAIEVRITDALAKKALILVDDEALSLAIGKEGQNVRLAAKLTGWNLAVQGIADYEKNGMAAGPEAKTETPAEEAVTEDKPKAKKAKAEKKTESENEIAALGFDAKTVKLIDAAGITTKDALIAALNSDEGIKGVGPKTKEKILAALA